MRGLLAVLVSLGCAAPDAGPGATSAGGEAPEAEECAATLRVETFDEADEGEEIEIPRARLTAVRHCERSGSSTLPVGVETGICTPAAPSRPGVVARVSCWWAGGGTEVELVRRGDSLVIVRTAVDELRGPAAPSELGAIGLPEHSELVPLSAAGD
jgi:hypothetical protein